MQPNLETERLLLRPRSLGDLADLVAMDADPEVMRYVGGLWAGPGDAAEELARRIARPLPKGLGYWSIFPREAPGLFLGWVAIIPDEGREPGEGDGAGMPEVEIGWRLARPAWGRGYAREAAAALLRHAFGPLGLERVVANIHPGNDRSIRVAEAIGMRFFADRLYEGEPCKSFEALRQAGRGKPIPDPGPDGSRRDRKDQGE